MKRQKGQCVKRFVRRKCRNVFGCMTIAREKIENINNGGGE